MRSFKKMVKEKKSKVLTLVVLLFLFNAFYRVKGARVPRLNHITRDGRTGLEGMCIARNEDVYSAVDWTFPIPENYEDLPVSDSYFLPNQTSSINCNFEKLQECSNAWKSDIWTIPEYTDRNYQPIFDYRWEGFKTYLITKNTTFLHSRIEVLNSNITVSVRSDKPAMILLCESWLPDKHPCYTIFLGGVNNKIISLQKYGDDSVLSEYKSTVNVLSFDQWKTFTISLSDFGDFIVRDPLSNITLLKYNDKAQLKPIFMFMKSEEPSLWKIHENYFLFANTSISTRFGPDINITGKEWCISMYVSMCEDCKISFYSKNDTESDGLLLHVDGNDLKATWKSVRITKSNYQEDILRLFVTTESNSTDSYWMIDNIRSCSSTEIKVKTIANPDHRTNFNLDDPHISCTALWMQHWRPKPSKISLNTLPMISTNQSSTSIKLSWIPITVSEQHLPYLIRYQGHHLCPTSYVLRNASTLRLKSNGWMVSSGNDVTIDDLIPYTYYSVVLQDIVYGNVKNLSLNTNETENITQYEVPKNVRISVTQNSAELFFDEPSCNDVYGRILHRYSVDKLNDSFVSPGSTYKWQQKLRPFTNYTLAIETARNLKNLNEESLRNIVYHNFTTKPDIAPAMMFLEPYEITKDSVYLRYQISKEPKGIPESVRIEYCNSLIKNNCEYKFENVTKCSLWDNLYCTKVEKLMKKRLYKISASIKNYNTNTYGRDLQIRDPVLLKSNVPGIPTNLTHKVVNCSKENDYCHLNISWDHPYLSYGEITAFEIDLKQEDTDREKIYNDIFLVDDRKYKRRYSHAMNYLPYSMKYNVSVRAVNSDFKGEYVSGIGEIDHIGQHIDQMPKVIKQTSHSLIVQLPTLDVRLSSSVLLTIVQGTNQGEIEEFITDLALDNLCHNGTETWLANVIELTKEDTMFAEIGDGTSIFSDYLQRDIHNKELQPNQEYCINFIIQNTYHKVNHTIIYHLKHSHTAAAPAESKPSNKTVQIIVILLALVLLTAIGIIIYKKRSNLPCRKVKQDGEHIYEAMPFDDYTDVPNVVYNQTYDKLNHS